jgi:hypothetical protein
MISEESMLLITIKQFLTHSTRRYINGKFLERGKFLLAGA